MVQIFVWNLCINTMILKNYIYPPGFHSNSIISNKKITRFSYLLATWSNPFRLKIIHIPCLFRFEISFSQEIYFRKEMREIFLRRQNIFKQVFTLLMTFVRDLLATKTYPPFNFWTYCDMSKQMVANNILVASWSHPNKPDLLGTNALISDKEFNRARFLNNHLLYAYLTDRN